MQIEEDRSYIGAKIQEAPQEKPPLKMIEEEKLEKNSVSRILNPKESKFPRFLRPNVDFERKGKESN